MQEMIRADWCQDACPKLATFNKVYTLRGGRGLVQNIVLIGTDEDIELCAAQEAKFFADAGMMLSDVVCRDKTDRTSPQVYLLNNDKDLERNIGSLYFFKECDAKDKNEFDITGISKNDRFDFSEFINTLDFKELTQDMLYDFGIAAALEASIKETSLEQTVNNVLMAHYEEFDDNVCRIEVDFAWLNKGSIKNEPTITESIVSEPEKMEPEIIKEDTKHIIMSDTKINEPTINSEQHKVQAESEKKAETQQHKNETEKAVEEQNQNPVPAPVSKKQDSDFIVKTTLSADEDKKNRELLEVIRKQYKDTIDFIEKTCNSQWSIIKNRMQDELSSNQFKVQWCPAYLEISSDNSTELYRRLYELDIATKEFHKSVVHQVIHMGCAFCAHEWNEDVTFLSPGPHFIECPECYMERGFEKQEPKTISSGEE